MAFCEKAKAILHRDPDFNPAWSLDNTVWPFVLRMLIDKITAFTPAQGNLWYYLMPLLIFWAAARACH